MAMFLSSLLVQTARSFAVRRIARHVVVAAAAAPRTRVYSSKSEKDEDPVASFFDELARKDGFDSDSAMYAQFEEEEDATTTNAMDARISQARRDRDLGKITVSSEMDDYFASLGYEQEEEPFGDDETPRNSKQPLVRPPLPHAQLVTDPLSCSACGSRFQTSKEERPGYLPAEKYELQVQFSEWKQKYDLQQKAESREWSAEDEIDFLIEAAKENEPELPIAQSAGEEDTSTEATMLAMLSSDKPVICKRCFRLQHHGHVEEALRPGWTDDPALQQENFRRLLAPISSKTAVIIALVDLFDFSGSVLPELDWIAGEENPVILAANKADLLPPRLGPNRAENWVRRELEYLGVRSIANVGGAVRLISCKTGAGVRSLLTKAEKLATERDCDIYVVGAANAGKSTFLNHILMQNKQEDGDDNIPVFKKRAGNMNKFKGAVTTSPLPGTTLQFLKVDLGNTRSLYDTPGLLVPGTITQLLSTEELKVVVPKSRVEPITFRLASGKAVLVGGLAKIELIGDSKPFLFTFFVANAIKLHPTDSTKSDDFVKTHVGTMLTPPASLERYEALGEWETHVITVDGMGWKEAAGDITLTGLGWVGVTGSGEAKVRVTVPKGVGVTLRPPLMPFDVWETTARYTGAKPVRKISKAKYGSKKRTKGVGRR